MKNALAYDRDVAFDEPDATLARQAWGKASPSPAERKAFGDFVVDHLCRLAGERDLPMQMHLGTAIIRGSHPLKIAGKTGTAEVKGAPSHAWFVGFAPYGQTRKRIAFAVIIENAGYGGLAAAPVAGEIVTAAAALGLIN